MLFDTKKSHVAQELPFFLHRLLYYIPYKGQSIQNFGEPCTLLGAQLWRYYKHVFVKMPRHAS